MKNNKFLVNLRVIKEGQMAYFSQLDLTLILKRALRRTSLPNYFTNGFRPHIKISFRDALKLGQEGEVAAIFYFSKEVSEKKVIDQLSKQLPSGLRVDSNELENKVKN